MNQIYKSFAAATIALTAAVALSACNDNRDCVNLSLFEKLWYIVHGKGPKGPC